MERPLLLLVENSRTALAGLTLKLEAAGYAVEGVRFGTEAIEKAQQTSYFAIVMDLFMPQMNGYEAAKKIRELGIKTPIFAFTASTDPRDKKTSLDAGMDGFIQKDDQLTELLPTLQELSKSLGTETADSSSSTPSEGWGTGTADPFSTPPAKK